MKRSILATSLCGALMSPLVGADILDEMPAVELMALWQQESCPTSAPAAQQSRCKNFIESLVTLSISKQSRRVIAQQVVEITQSHACADEELPLYGLSHEACLRGIAARAAHCERTQMPFVKLSTIMEFLMCITPTRACDAANTKDDPAWKEHCNELAWDGNG